MAEPVRLSTSGSPTYHEVEVAEHTFCFSYSTCIAVGIPGSGFFKSENVWSRTTAKHLGMVPGGSFAKVLPHTEFVTLLASISVTVTAEQ